MATDANPKQTSMFEAFDEADFQRRTAHLPSTVEDGIPCYRDMIKRFNAAIIACKPEAADVILQEAEHLAARINGGITCGINSGPGSACDQLARATAAPLA